MFSSLTNSPGIEVYSHANAFFCFVRETCSLIRWVKTLKRTFWMANYVAKLLWAEINALRKLSVSRGRGEYSTGPFKAWAHCLVFRRLRRKQVTRSHGYPSECQRPHFFFLRLLRVQFHAFGPHVFSFSVIFVSLQISVIQCFVVLVCTSHSDVD